MSPSAGLPTLATEEDLPAVADLLALSDGAREAFLSSGGLRSEALVCKSAEGAVIGCAVFFELPDLATGGAVARLAALQVRAEDRGMGQGKALMIALAALCGARGYQRLDWSVARLDLDARTFFDLLVPDSFQLNQLVYSVESDALAALAKR